MTKSISYMQYVYAVILVILATAIPVNADQHQGSAEQAKEMVAQAIAYYDEVGADQALKKFTENPSPEFFDRDLYVFVVRTDGPIVAHGVDTSLVGIDIRKFVDSDGREFGKKMLKTASPQGTWIDYKARHFSDGQIVEKSTWMVLHDSHLFGVGIYKE